MTKATLFQNLGSELDINWATNLSSPQHLAFPITLPPRCASYGSLYCSGQMYAIRVSYVDGGLATWLMCRCSNAPLTFNDMISFFGRVPHALRSHVRHILAFKDSQRNGAPHAFMSSNDTVYFNIPDQNTWIHESAHASDLGFSASRVWAEALENDSCLPDKYSTTSPQEGFAQAVVVKVYVTVTGSLPDGAECMANQLAALSTLPIFKPPYPVALVETSTACDHPDSSMPATSSPHVPYPTDWWYMWLATTLLIVGARYSKRRVK